MDGSVTLSAAEEAQWISRAKEGDHAAFEAIYQQYERPIFQFIYRMVGNPEEALDLTQECFVRAYRALPSQRGELNLGGWLRRIAANLCLDTIRRRNRFRWLPWEHRSVHERSADLDNPEHAMLRIELRELIQHVLNEMHPRHRLVLLLREHEGLSTTEIAEILGISQGAVKSLLFRAREEFRTIYSQKEQANAS
jgi:RNA polymerase sigma-70 factor (ECF subfamily)